MDSKQNVGTATKTSQKQITAYVAGSTSALTVENVPANLLKTRKKSLTERLKPLLLSLLKAQKTEWGYMAMSTKEICRQLNGVKDRSFCHFAFQHSNKTEKSWSEKRGCRNLKRSVIPCKFSYKEIWRALQQLVKIGEVESFRGRGLDLKQMGKCKIVSSDSYRFYKMKEVKA